MTTTEILNEDAVESTRNRKVPRAELVAALVERDGTKCMFPGCNSELDLSITDGPREVTIDHWIPQWFGKENGWTWDKIWALDNLVLMEKKCNAKKGERLPNDDGSLPPRVQSTFKFRRQKRAGRPDLCGECDNGHNLGRGEVCANCGCNAQRFPKSAKIRASECDHEVFWCPWCSIGVIPRPASVDTAVRQGESGEWD